MFTIMWPSKLYFFYEMFCLFLVSSNKVRVSFIKVYFTEIIFVLYKCKTNFTVSLFWSLIHNFLRRGVVYCVRFVEKPNFKCFYAITTIYKQQKVWNIDFTGSLFFNELTMWALKIWFYFHIYYYHTDEQSLNVNWT